MSSTTKRYPAWQIVRRLRRRGLTQRHIADRVGCSQQFVSNVINRFTKDTAMAERVWIELDAALNNESVA